MHEDPGSDDLWDAACVGAFPGAEEVVSAICPRCGQIAPVELLLQADEFTYRGRCRRCGLVCLGSRTPPSPVE